MILSETCTPSDMIDRKLAERNVLNTEINALNTLRLSKKNTELEKNLAKEYYDYLYYKVLICDKEIYRIFYEELPADSPDRDDILDKIECVGVEQWTYKSDVPVKSNTLTMDIETYKSLSYREKIEQKIAELNILDAGINAIKLRCKAKKINEHETKLLAARESELTMSLIFCIKELWRISWDEVPQGTQEDKEFLQRFKEVNITKEKNDELFKSLKNLRQKHV